MTDRTKIRVVSPTGTVKDTIYRRIKSSKVTYKGRSYKVNRAYTGKAGYKYTIRPWG